MLLSPGAIRAIVPIAGLLLLSGCPAQVKEVASMSQFETLFDAAVTRNGAPYVSARTAVLALGPGTIPDLEAVLARQPDWQQALTASILLGWLATPDLYQECAELANGVWQAPPGPRPITGKPNVAARATRLYQKGDQVVPRLLEMVLKTDELSGQEARAAVFGALRYFKEPETLAPMVDVVEDAQRDPEERTLAVSVLQALAAPEAADALFTVLQEPGNAARLRGAAGIALAEWADARAALPLAALATAPATEQALRLDALFALSRLRDGRVEGQLVHALTHERDEVVVLSLVNALGELGSRTAIPALRSACDRWQEPDVCEATGDSIRAITNRTAGAGSN